MSFQDAMNTMLRPIQDGNRTVSPHITSGFGVWRADPQLPNGGRFHNAVDFNYEGGQASRHNQNHPDVYSPVSGTVVFSGGRWGTVSAN